MTIDVFRDWVLRDRGEISFDLDGNHYFVSSLAGCNADGRICICGPGTQAFAKTVDEALDRLMIGATPLRAALPRITEPYC